ncbi:MAG: 4'-phosphopantetheinyl transferase superfamily protein [Magnetococcales bacterium]|nr:4'-phosphopantetheinyl transferase superfamily protein [Magnetococcales bacterium]
MGNHPEQVQQLKAILSAFTGLSEQEIDEGSPANRQAIGASSIRYHQFLAAVGGVVPVSLGEWKGVETFGDLLRVAGLQEGGGVPAGRADEALADLPDDKFTSRQHFSGATPPTLIPRESGGPSAPLGEVVVGIDLEELDRFGRVDDYGSDPFYKDNFTPEEMAYCQQQPDPIASFAGRFAVKEALVKADNGLGQTPFNQIGISVDGEGRPTYPGFSISLSHSEKSAVGVAVKVVGGSAEAQSTGGKTPLILSVAALVISLLALWGG